MANSKRSAKGAPRRPTSGELAVLPSSILSQLAAPSLGRVTHLFPRWMAEKLKHEPGLTPPRVMLMWLLSRFDDPTMGELAHVLDLTPRAITRLVDGLEAEGLVERMSDPKDGRVFRIRLTRSGQNRMKVLAPKLQSDFVDLFSGLERKEIRELIRLTEKLSDHMASMLGED